MKNLNPVCWFDINVTNLEESKKFYEKVLDTKLTDLPVAFGRQSTFPFSSQGPNTTGALVEQKELIANGNNTVIYFQSEDCTTEEAKVQNAGGKVIRSKMSIGEFGFISLFRDLDGNTIGLHSRQ